MIVPDSVGRLLPVEGKAFYESVFVNSYSRTGDDVLSHEVAWSLTRSRMRESEGVLVCNSEDFIPHKLYSFSFSSPDEIVVKNHDNGEIELTAVLATTEARKSDGKSFDVQSLNELAEQINTEGSTFPDVEHEALTALQEKYPFDVDALVSAVKREKGVFKKIKAVVKDGRLWIQAFLDKRYHNYVDRFKKLSIEALAKPVGDKLVKPRYLGFTFTNTPQLSGASIV